MSIGKTFGEGDKSLKRFEQQLALYRAKVYEKYMPMSGLNMVESSELVKSESCPILVIEDNADDWVLMQWALQQTFPATETVWLASANQVSTYLKNCLSNRQALPKMILLDLYLPSIKKGLFILQTLKAHRRLREVPVITVSRSSNAKDMADAFRYASSLYLIKPLTFSDWVKRIGELRNLVRC